VQTWVLSNHDVVRHATRLAVSHRRASLIGGIGPDDPAPDTELGLRRARAATALMLALPGAAYLYQGEELGLPEATTLPADVRQDPTFRRSGGEDVGRDGCRVPMPWEADRPAFGFNATGTTWLPQPKTYGPLAVDRQRGVPDSTLELYRALLALRRDRGLGRGELRWLDGFGPDVVAFAVVSADRATTVLANFAESPLALPAGSRVLVTSGPSDRELPADTAAWLDGELSARQVATHCEVSTSPLR
uniref:alpha-amylase family glycosyl hydrolase n=1 Tax=uncultured Aeromicrobium sp. TaxID=337820 RepID=UPI0025F98E89